MRRWASRAASAADDVSRRPELWLPGALAWAATAGWIAMIIGVGRAPSIAELTFAGAGFYTSGAWPWNVVVIGVAALLTLGLASVLVSLAEGFLVPPGRPSGRTVARTAALGLVCSVPALAALLALAAAAFVVAPAEFNAPQNAGGPVLRTAARLAPLIVAVVVAVIAGAAAHAASSRRAATHRIGEALRGVPADLARTGAAALIQPIAAFVARIAYIVLAATFLRVLWGPIAERLAAEGIDAAVMLLLVGFVAIWLCLVLAGGALHAWGSLTWTRVLGAARVDALAGRHGMEPRGRT